MFQCILSVCLVGMEAKAVLSQSGLVHTTLAQVWFVAYHFSINDVHMITP